MQWFFRLFGAVGPRSVEEPHKSCCDSRAIDSCGSRAAHSWGLRDTTPSHNTMSAGAAMLKRLGITGGGIFSEKTRSGPSSSSDSGGVNDLNTAASVGLQLEGVTARVSASTSSLSAAGGKNRLSAKARAKAFLEKQTQSQRAVGGASSSSSAGVAKRSEMLLSKSPETDKDGDVSPMSAVSGGSRFSNAGGQDEDGGVSDISWISEQQQGGRGERGARNKMRSSSRREKRCRSRLRSRSRQRHGYHHYHREAQDSKSKASSLSSGRSAQMRWQHDKFSGGISSEEEFISHARRYDGDRSSRSAGDGGRMARGSGDGDRSTRNGGDGGRMKRGDGDRSSRRGGDGGRMRRGGGGDSDRSTRGGGDGDRSTRGGGDGVRSCRSGGNDSAEQMRRAGGHHVDGHVAAELLAQSRDDADNSDGSDDGAGSLNWDPPPAPPLLGAMVGTEDGAAAEDEAAVRERMQRIVYAAAARTAVENPPPPNLTGANRMVFSNAERPSDTAAAPSSSSGSSKNPAGVGATSSSPNPISAAAEHQLLKNLVSKWLRSFVDRGGNASVSVNDVVREMQREHGSSDVDITVDSLRRVSPFFGILS